MAQHETVLLNSGGMRSLVATAIVSQRYPAAGVVLVFIDEPPARGPAAAADSRPDISLRHELFNAQADHYEFNRRIELKLPEASGLQTAPGIPMAYRLMAAVDLAMKCEAARVIWPVQSSDNHDGVSRITETMLLAQQLMKLERGRTLAIEAPLLELTDFQLVQVGHQLNVPWELARSCTAPVPKLRAGEMPPPCNQCAACQRRRAAFEHAAIEDPLTSPVANRG
jgi:hypothetical protein